LKKFKAILIIVLSFLITYFLQVNLFSWFTIRGVSPNLFVGIILLIGLFIGKKIGALFGATFGFILDCLVGKIIGPYTVLLCLVGLLGEYFDKNFSKDSLISIIIMYVIATVLFEIGYYGFECIKLGFEPEILRFIIILLVEAIYNSVLIIIFYPAIKRAGYYIENVFKGKKLLTRYF